MIPSFPASFVVSSAPASLIIQAGNISAAQVISGANVPPIGFSLLIDSLRVKEPRAPRIHFTRGTRVSTQWGELVVLQDTPPVLFDPARLDAADAFSAWREWDLAAVMLPERDTAPVFCGGGGQFYKMCDIAPCLGKVTGPDLSRHAMRMFRPNYEGNYRLDFDETLRLMRFYLQNGKLFFSRDELESRARQKLKSLAAILA